MAARNPKLKTAYLDIAAEAQKALGVYPWKVTHEALATICRTQAFKDFGRELQADSVIGPKLSKIVTADGFPPASLTDSQLVAALLSYFQFFREAITSDPDDVYQQFEDALYTEEVTFRAQAPIHFLMPTFEELHLDECVRLRRLTIPESDLFVAPKILPDFGELTPPLLFEATWKQKLRFPRGAVAEKDWRIPTIGSIGLTRLVFSLRLLGFRLFDIPSLIVYSGALGVPLGFQRFFHMPSPFKGTESLGGKHAFRLQQFWGLTPQLFGEKMPAWLRTTLTRLNMACLREDPQDGLLDLVIALEALLEYRGDLEIAYRLKKRGGVMMGLGESRQRLPEAVAFAESTIKKSYKMRSAIVHGERTKGYSSKEIEAVNEALFVLIRVVSLKLVGLGGTSMPQENLLGGLIDESMSSPPMRKALETRLQDSGLLDYLEN